MVGSSLRDVRNRLIRMGADEFKSATPFRHLVIEQPFDDYFVARAFRSVPPDDDPRWFSYQTADQQKLDLNKIETLEPPLVWLFDYLRSDEWLDALSTATGIPGLMAGPQPYGAALHVSRRDSELRLHLDASEHRETGQQRRLNLLFFINPDWQRCWGGEFLLDGPEVQRKIAPLFNRMVVFETTDVSFHGHAKVTCPPEQRRVSLAVWYFTATQHRARAAFRSVP